MRREWTEAELVEALHADLARPYREVRRTNLRRVREQAEGVAEAAEAATKRKRRKRNRWTAKRPGELRAIRARLQAGDTSGLSSEARRVLALIAARPDVTISRRWTTAKVPRVTITPTNCADTSAVGAPVLRVIL